jgi:signal transduction histidine kinase
MNEILEFLNRLSSSVTGENQKKSLDVLFLALRKQFLFDNLAVYIAEKAGGMPEVIYARAAGRGRSKEAEASWGEEIATQVIQNGKSLVIAPTDSSNSDRIAVPYLLGLPLELIKREGALVFVRFGGPEFKPEQLPLAMLAAVQAARILERAALRESLDKLMVASHRAQLQDDFIATISHELHTPLGFIKGYTTSLLRSDTTWNPATQLEFLTIIDEESDHLLTLIDRMLASARLQSGNMPMDFQPVRLDSLLRDEIMRIQGRYQNIEIVANLPPTQPILADTVRLAQVFENLFDNAIKYAPNSKITLTLESSDTHQTVIFADQGMGIPSEHLPFLFERFYRVPGNPGKHGTGLGLFICKQIILAHHGQISVKTTPGKGTAFRIELPTH